MLAVSNTEATADTAEEMDIFDDQGNLRTCPRLLYLMEDMLGYAGSPQLSILGSYLSQIVAQAVIIESGGLNRIKILAKGSTRVAL